MVFGHNRSENMMVLMNWRRRSEVGTGRRFYSNRRNFALVKASFFFHFDRALRQSPWELFTIRQRMTWRGELFLFSAIKSPKSFGKRGHGACDQVASSALLG